MNNLTALCHITPEYNAPSILEYGISASPNGYIYMFEDGDLVHPSGKSIPMSDIIALLLNKIQTNQYFKFSIDPKGFETTIERDNLPTFGGGYHWKVRQERIKSEFIRVVDNREAIKKDTIELRNMFFADKLGLPYQGQSYQQLCQIAIKRHTTPGDNLRSQVISDEWEHGNEPPTVMLDKGQLLKILDIRRDVYLSRHLAKS